MSRRTVARAASPEEIFAKRRGETPYQIYFEISNIGRNVESSKKRARWKFCFGDEGRELEVTLVHSLMTGKKKTFFNGEMINEAQKVTKEWAFAWSFGAHLMRVGINFEEYSLVIDGVPFRSFNRRDPYLAAQLEATKRDSMRSLRTDEQRRFDRLGYAAGSGGGGGGGRDRARTAERRRPSSRSVSSTGSHRASSTGRGRDSEGNLGPRRSSRRSDDGSMRRSSSSVERGTDRRRSSPPARSSSDRRMNSPPSASGPGNQRRGNKKASGRQARESRGMGRASAAANGERPGGSSNTNNGAETGRELALTTTTPSGDILSADPSTLDVNPFDVHLTEQSFDPLSNRKQPSAAGGGGGGYANGGTTNAGGGGDGAWGNGGGGGFGGGYGGTGVGEDTAAVLQLGMQFEAMGMNQQFQQQQQQFTQPPPQQQQQQQQYQTPFDQGSYQQYDQSGFAQPPPQQQQQQQSYNNAQQDPFADPGQIFGAPPVAGSGLNASGNAGGDTGGGGGGGGFIGYQGGVLQQEQPQQQQQQQQASSIAPSTQRNVEDGKSSLDPWDMARAGMVNIDDITDTKHLPAVEVKPFTNDHRPLADLVRETPAKVNAPVMMERPEPAPTHMAVAIVPVQRPGQQQQQQQQTGYGQQGGFPQQQQQQQNGNPFAQLQLTQYGQQAQPIMYSQPDDPFYRL